MNESLTRRRMISALASIGAGVVASPFMLRRAFANDTDAIADLKMAAAIFFDPHIPSALQRALNYAGDNGFVASMPQLMHARANAPYDNLIWNTWFTANSEESVVTTPQGNRAIVAIHGGGIFTKPERFERSYHADLDRDNPEGITGQTAAKITQEEAHNALQGRLPDGSEIPIYSFEEFKRGVANLPMRYGVILDYELARKSKRGYERFEILKDDPNMIVRAGVERLAPVLMTALTSGIGLVPLVLAAGEPGKEILYPVATVIIGGLVSSTLLEFFVRPALFWTLGVDAARHVVEAGAVEVPLIEEEVESPEA